MNEHEHMFALMQGASAFALPTAMRTGLNPLPLFETWHVYRTCLLTLSARTS